MEEKNKFNFKTIIKGFLDAFNIEKGIIPTLRDLLLRPGDVIHYYIDGHRGKYFTPGRFFATILALLSLILYFTGSFDSKTIQYVFLEGRDSNSMPEEIALLVSNIMLLIANNAVIRLALIIIPSVFVSWIVFYKYRYNIAKHFVIHIYCWCLISVLAAFFSLFIDQELYLQYGFEQIGYDLSAILPPLAISNSQRILYLVYETISYFLPIIYYIHAFKSIFKLKLFSSVLRSLIFLFVTFILLFSFALFIGIYQAYLEHSQ